MSDDTKTLVERLRYAAKPHQSSPLERDTLLAQAADRIEALEAEVARYRPRHGTGAVSWPDKKRRTK